MPYKINISLRLLAATLGAYALSVLFSLATVPLFVIGLSSLLSDAVYAATMWSYVVFFGVFIASFAVSSVKRLYSFLCISAIVLYGSFVLASPIFGFAAGN